MGQPILTPAHQHELHTPTTYQLLEILLHPIESDEEISMVDQLAAAVWSCRESVLLPPGFPERHAPPGVYGVCVDLDLHVRIVYQFGLFFERHLESELDGPELGACLGRPDDVAWQLLLPDFFVAGSCHDDGNCGGDVTPSDG